ncbi:chorismate-binding protein, partial [Acutalibacter sp. 1XD8-33]|uniref:chorismate-binding protein n=1 Tax=Acutalibacter sp. 1XD8-33 TaxID=2320081 RepID=UPI001FAB025B
MTCKDGLLRVGETEMRVEHPGPVLRQILREHKSPREPGLPPFTGYFAYDYLKYAEPSLNLDAEDREQFQDTDLMLFEQVICFDNYHQKIILIANADAENLDESYLIACGQLEQTTALLKYGRPMEHRPGRLTTPLTPLFDLPAYKAMVERGKAYIREGDIFQVVLSNRLEAGFEGSLLDAYRVLRSTTPSPYRFYFTSESMELAEHNMLVDLGRNGLGKISKFGATESTSSRPISPFNTWNCFLVDRDT